MKNSTTSLIIAFSIAIVSMAFSPYITEQKARTSKTLVKTFHFEDVNAELDFDAPVEIIASKRKNVRFLININNKHYRTLIADGKYSMKREIVNGRAVYSMPNLSQKIKVNGKVIEDNVSITALVPLFKEPLAIDQEQF